MAFGFGAVTPHSHGRDAVIVEVAGHELGVVDAHAEPEAAHRGQVIAVIGDLLDRRYEPRRLCSCKVAQCLDVVAPSAPPRDVGEVEPVVDPEVHERHQPLLIDSVPQPQLRGDAVIEPVEHRQPVAALGRGGEAEQLDRGHEVEQALIRRCGGVVELVDDHDVEVIGIEVLDARRVEALDRGEDVIETARAGAPGPLLTERRFPQHVAKRGERSGRAAPRDERRTAAAPDAATGSDGCSRRPP